MLREAWEQQSSAAITPVTTEAQLLMLVPNIPRSIYDLDDCQIIELLIRHRCPELRFGRRPVRARAKINADGWVKDLDTGMLTTDVDNWISACAIEQRDRGYSKSTEVNQYTQVDVFLGHEWIKLGEFLERAQRDEGDTPPALSYAA